MPKSLTRMAYVLSMHGPDVKRTVVDYIRTQAALTADDIASARIVVSDFGTTILDLGRDYSALELKTGGAILISQPMLHAAIMQHFAINDARFEITATAFELKQPNRPNPIEDCAACFLVTRRITTDTTPHELLALIEQLFSIHEIDSDWYWKSGATPASLALYLIVVMGEAGALAQFITTVNASNAMNPRNQLIDLGWALVRTHGDWLVRNPNVIDALLARRQGLTQPLIDDLLALKRRSYH